MFAPVLRAAMILAVVPVVALSGCSSSSSAPEPTAERPTRTLEPAFPGAPEFPPPDLTDDGAGSLVSVTPLTNVGAFAASNATAVKVIYRSTASDGKPVEVSGIVVVPPGRVPKGGWPIISFGHTLTGLETRCAPSLAQEAGGYAGPISTLLGAGYAVAMSDYLGLGIDNAPPHQPLDWVSLGNNVIDVVRAARRVTPSIGTSWAAEGIGQGGLAAWAAAARARDYGAGLTMVGAAVLAPYTDLSALADEDRDGTLDTNQTRLMALLLDSLSRTVPGFDLDAYRSQFARDNWTELLDCAPNDPKATQQLTAQFKSADLRPRDDAAVTALRDALAAAAIRTTGPLAAPVLVIYASLDTLVPQAGITSSLRAACSQGSPMVVMKLIGETNSINPQVVQTAVGWLGSRFDGERVGDVCVSVS